MRCSGLREPDAGLITVGELDARDLKCSCRASTVRVASIALAAQAGDRLVDELGRLLPARRTPQTQTAATGHASH